MVPKQTGILMEYPSRREVLRDLAGLMIAMSLEGCAQSLVSSSVAVPTPTPRPRGSAFYIYRGHTDRVTTVAWSSNGKNIASGSSDKTVQVWDAATGAVLYTYRGYNVQAAQANPTKGVLPDIIYDVAWSHNGKRIAAVTQVYCGDNCGVVLGWDAYTEHNFSFYVDLPVFAIAWSPDDTRLATSIVGSTQGLPQGGAPQDGSFVKIAQA
jgi:WD40 repeat protein